MIFQYRFCKALIRWCTLCALWMCPGDCYQYLTGWDWWWDCHFLATILAIICINASRQGLLHLPSP